MSRPFLNKTESELRQCLKDCKDDLNILRTLRYELFVRGTQTARQLLVEVDAIISNFDSLDKSTGTTPLGFVPLSPDSPQAKAAGPKIAELRQQLLDLSSRNRSLNFKHTPTSGRYVRIVDESAPSLFEQLQSGRKVELVPIPDPPDEPDDEATEEFRSAFEQAILTDKAYLKAVEQIATLGADDAESRLRAAQRALRDRLRRRLRLPTRGQATLSLNAYATRLGIRPEYDLVDSRLRSRTRRENEWQTLLGYEELSRRLRGIDQTAREAQQEFGIETLYFVFGFLEWYPITPDGEAEDMLLSPLVLQLASIQKRPKPGPRTVKGRRLLELEVGDSANQSRETYLLAAADAEEPAVNLTLKERLRADFGFLLPDLDPEEPDLASFFERVSHAIRAHPNWRLRRFVTLTHLSFSRLPMWHDLAPNVPNTLPPQQHPLLGELFGGRKHDPSESNYPEAVLPDAVPVLVLDADSSQHSAIAAALSGRNLVIQGPPGTGKSQTIANLIAAAMWQGKTVLFVAEKLVALQAVYKRLAEQAQLGDFILELHSAKAGKKPVIESIRKRIEKTRIPGNAAADQGTRRQHWESAQALDAYAAAINAPFGKLGWSLHNIVWRHLQNYERALPEGLHTFEFSDAESWTTHDWSARRTTVLEWADLAARRAREPVDSHGQHPWYWVLATDAYVAEQAHIIGHCRQIAAFTDHLDRFLSDTGFGRPETTLRGLAQLEGQLRQLGVRPSAIRPGMWMLAGSLDGRSRVQGIVNAHRLLEGGLQTVRSVAPQLLDEPDPALSLHRFGEFLKGLTTWHDMDTVDALRERLSITESWIDLSPKASEVVNGIGDLLGPATDFNNPTIIRAVASLIELVAATPAVALGRGMDCQNDQYVSLLRDAIEKAESLRKFREELRSLTQFDFDSLSSEVVAGAVGEFASSWFGCWLFSAGYRRACRLAAEIGPELILRDRVALLRRISDFLEKKTTLQSHPSSILTAGLFDGMDSNLDELRALVDWVDRVRDTTPILPPVNIQVRSVVFALRRDLHDLAVNLAASHFPQQLREIARICEVGSVSFSGLSELLQGERRLIEDALALATKWQWRESICHARRQTITTALHEIAAAKSHLEQSKDDATLFLPDISVGCREFDQVEDALRRITSTGLPTEWQRRLSSEVGAATWETAINHASVLRGQLERMQSALASLAALACFVPQLSSDWFEMPLAKVRSRLSVALAAESALVTQCASMANQMALRQLGLESFVKAIHPLPEPHGETGTLLDRVFIRSLCHAAFARVPALQPFRHSSPGAIRQKFRQYDQELKNLDRTALASRLMERRPPPGDSVGRVGDRTEMGLLNYVCGLQAPRTPVRDLLRRSGRALQALKPCFMMSPLSVAQLVDRRALSFDIVVFDEASQIRPEDALSALARGRQFIVVGDSLQLPPTSFGIKSVGATEEDYEGEEESAVVESILELSAAAYGEGPRLLWHYRSRDPALIAFSNKKFYKNDLRLFPAPHHRSPSTGVHYLHVDGVYSSRTNLIEAQKCAHAALEFMRTYPERSLGIVALNRPQADLIEVELERLVSKDPQAIAYRARWEDTIEPLFVKNLESVQGDERDVIFISTVFGPEDDGNFFQRFGPINSKVGHRRLNVLFTRAKYQVVVISSIPVEKIALSETSHWGVRVLKEYLEFARSGRLESGLISGKPTESPFEDAVLKALTTEGFQCEPQVGVRGFFIDLGVRSPIHPDQFVIGIECDGAEYHNTRAARDRDRLRQEILENLGWKIYRIWSTDWFANPRHELHKLVGAIREEIRKNPNAAPQRTLAFLQSNGIA